MIPVSTRRLSVLRQLRLWAYRRDPVRLLVLGYLSNLALGWLLLCLPFSQAREGISLLDHLFTAVSAMSTTGLATVSVGSSYSSFGQTIVLLLIQAGGLGYMTLGSFVLLTVSGRLSPLRARVGAMAWSMPEEFDVRAFLRLIWTYTFAIEFVGAVAYYFYVFRDLGLTQPVWQSVFHSISAFCTAGFSLLDDGFVRFRGHAALNTITIVLSLLGAIGFLVVNDVWNTLRRRRLHLTLTTKIILVSTFTILVIGTGLFYFQEPSIAALPTNERALSAFFQVMSATTTVGFNSIPIEALSDSALFLLTVAMLIGASPAGTGGGLKTTTVSALWAVMMSALRRRSQSSFLGREIPDARIRSAVAGTMFYGFTLVVGLYLFTLFEEASFADQAFECASALGTVGLSRGLTSGLADASKWVLIGLMFAGRVGPLVLGMSLLAPRRSTEQLGVGVPEEDIVT